MGSGRRTGACGKEARAKRPQSLGEAERRLLRGKQPACTREARGGRTDQAPRRLPLRGGGKLCQALREQSGRGVAGIVPHPVNSAAVLRNLELRHGAGHSKPQGQAKQRGSGGCDADPGSKETRWLGRIRALAGVGDEPRLPAGS